MADIIEGEKDTWSVKDGILVQQGGDGAQWLMFGDPAWTDYEYSFQFKNSHEGLPLSILFRSPDNSRSVNWGLGWLGQKAILEYRESPERHVGIEEPKPYPATSSNEWYEMKVVVTGAEVSCHLDDELVVWQSDHCRFNSGRVGVRLWRRGGWKTSFKNFLVKNSAGKVLWSELPSLE